MFLQKEVLLFHFMSLSFTYQSAFQAKLPYTCDHEPLSCPMAIAHANQSDECRAKRFESVELNRRYYKLTRSGEKQIIALPLRDIPILNQTLDAVKFYAGSELDTRWSSIVSVLGAAQGKFSKQFLTKFANVDFSKASDYAIAYEAYMKYVKDLYAQQSAQDLQFFVNPTLFSTFTDITNDGRYMSDDVFVQQRLVGPCPFVIKLVSKHGDTGLKWCELKEKLNTQHDFGADLRNAINEKDITMEQAVEEGRLYVLYHEELNDIQLQDDYYANERPLMNVTSPITLFARTQSGELKVVAIQIDYKPTSAVYSPKSNAVDWSIAKAVVNVGDIDVCQALWHLSHLHTSGSVYCTIFRSHFSDLHPIYQIMQHHCEGTPTHIALSVMSMVGPGFYGQQIFSVGYQGMSKLYALGNKKFKYDTLEYDNIIKSNGLGSNELKYYPFRDDGKVIWANLKTFGRDFTNLYYDTNTDVEGDSELQSFAKQTSMEGGPGDLYGGKGNIPGFPALMATKDEVATFITRFLWQIAIHNTVNYALEPWMSFVPLSPGKMYSNVQDGGANKGDHTFYRSLPDMKTTLATFNFVGFLGNLRINRLFDYHDKIQDKDLSKLIKKYRYMFSTCIQNLFEKRNEERKKNGQMGLQYLEPKWMTNSIHI